MLLIQDICSLHHAVKAKSCKRMVCPPVFCPADPPAAAAASRMSNSAVVPPLNPNPNASPLTSYLNLQTGLTLRLYTGFRYRCYTSVSNNASTPPLTPNSNAFPLTLLEPADRTHIASVHGLHVHTLSKCEQQKQCLLCQHPIPMSLHSLGT